MEIFEDLQLNSSSQTFQPVESFNSRPSTQNNLMKQLVNLLVPKSGLSEFQTVGPKHLASMPDRLALQRLIGAHYWWLLPSVNNYRGAPHELVMTHRVSTEFIKFINRMVQNGQANRTLLNEESTLNADRKLRTRWGSFSRDHPVTFMWRCSVNMRNSVETVAGKWCNSGRLITCR